MGPLEMAEELQWPHSPDIVQKAHLPVGHGTGRWTEAHEAMPPPHLSTTVKVRYTLRIIAQQPRLTCHPLKPHGVE